MTLRAFLFGSGDTSRSTDTGLLVLRVGVGLTMALAHGLGKIPPSEGFVEGTASMDFPFPLVFAWLAAISEFLGGMFIAIGVLTRPAAMMLAVTMGVARFVRHGGDAFGDGELSLIYLVAAIALAFTGAGRYSVDQMFWRRTATLRGL